MSDTFIPGNGSDFVSCRHAQYPRRHAIPQECFAAASRPRIALRDGAILARARGEPWPLPIWLRRPHSRTGPTTGRSGLLLSSTTECPPRVGLWSQPTTRSSSPTLTEPRLYFFLASRFRGSNFRGKTAASVESEPVIDEASTTRIVASTILARRSARSFNVTMGGNCTIRLPFL